MTTKPKSLTMGDLIRKQPPPIAGREYVHEVGRALDVDRELAEKIADFVVAEVERIGGADARLVMVVDESEDAGTGPWCSWCWFIGGLCAHIAGRPDDSEEASR